jgi:hypothetical protein
MAMTLIALFALASVSIKQAEVMIYSHHDGHKAVVLSCCVVVSLKGTALSANKIDGRLLNLKGDLQ